MPVSDCGSLQKNLMIEKRKCQSAERRSAGSVLIGNSREQIDFSSNLQENGMVNCQSITPDKELANIQQTIVTALKSASGFRK